MVVLTYAIMSPEKLKGMNSYENTFIKQGREKKEIYSFFQMFSYSPKDVDDLKASFLEQFLSFVEYFSLQGS